ncbi:hypothetical protein MRX96_007213 [Rhipicephalus microplus]
MTTAPTGGYASPLHNMQVDTGSPVSVITWVIYERNKPVWPKLRGSPFKLTCFLGRLPVRGQLELKVLCGNRSTARFLHVLGCSGPNLCGRDLIKAFHMLKAPVMNVNTSGGTPRRAPTRSEITGSTSTPALRHSGRQRKPPDCYSR